MKIIVLFTAKKKSKGKCTAQKEGKPLECREVQGGEKVVYGLVLSV